MSSWVILLVGILALLLLDLTGLKLHPVLDKLLYVPDDYNESLDEPESEDFLSLDEPVLSPKEEELFTPRKGSPSHKEDLEAAMRDIFGE